MSSIIDDLKLQYKLGDITIRLIFWNVFLFVVSEVIFSILKLFSIQINYINYVSLSSKTFDLFWKPWSILSYAFFHNDIIHLLVNMLMLYYVGRLFLTFFTQKQLLGTYILTALFSGIVYILGYTFLPVLSSINTQMIGASGAIMALLFATVTYQPYLEVSLFGVFKMQLWIVAFVFIFIDLIELSISNTGGHIAHLGGAFFGFIYIKFLKNGTDLSKIVSNIIDFFVSLFGKPQARPFKKVHKNYNTKPLEKKTSKIIIKDKNQQQIDEILDKISQSGYDCLTKDEKEFLFKAGK